VQLPALASPSLKSLKRHKVLSACRFRVKLGSRHDATSEFKLVERSILLV
jgi:hypothetical protein